MKRKLKVFINCTNVCPKPCEYPTIKEQSDYFIFRMKSISSQIKFLFMHLYFFFFFLVMFKVGGKSYRYCFNVVFSIQPERWKQLANVYFSPHFESILLTYFIHNHGVTSTSWTNVVLNLLSANNLFFYQKKTPIYNTHCIFIALNVFLDTKWPLFE